MHPCDRSQRLSGDQNQRRSELGIVVLIQALVATANKRQTHGSPNLRNELTRAADTVSGAAQVGLSNWCVLSPPGCRGCVDGVGAFAECPRYQLSLNNLARVLLLLVCPSTHRSDRRVSSFLAHLSEISAPGSRLALILLPSLRLPPRVSTRAPAPRPFLLKNTDSNPALATVDVETLLTVTDTAAPQFRTEFISAPSNETELPSAPPRPGRIRMTEIVQSTSTPTDELNIAMRSITHRTVTTKLSKLWPAPELPVRVERSGHFGEAKTGAT